MTRRWIGLVVVSAVAGALSAPAHPARAQELVVTARSAGDLIDDLGQLAKSLSAADEPNPAAQALEQLKAPDALKGLDRKRPLGAFASLPKGPGQPMTVVAFIPTTDGKAFLDTLRGFGFDVADEQQAPGFTHRVTLPTGMQVLALLTRDYAYFSLTPTGADALKTLKPETLLPGRKGAGDLSVTAHLDKVPDPMKGQILASAEQQLAAQREKKPDEDDARYQARLAGMKLAQDAVTSVLRDGRDLTLDLTIDARQDTSTLDLGLSAKPGTKLAASLKDLGSRKSLFGGLVKGAALSGWAAVPVTGPLRDSLNRALDNATKEAGEKARDKEMARKVLDAFRPTLAADEVDLAVSMNGPFKGKGADPTSVVLLAARVKDGRKIEQVLRDAARRAKPDAKTEVKLDVAKAADGTPIHRARFQADEKSRKSFGEPLIFLAIRPDVALAAVGESGLDVLKTALDAAKQPPAGSAAPVEMTVSAARFARLGITPDPEVFRKSAEDVFRGKDASKDTIRLSLLGEGEAVRLRLAVDLPTIRFFSVAGNRQKAAGANAAKP